MRVSADGRIAIPAEVRERCGLLPGTEVEVVVAPAGLLLRKSRERRISGRALVTHLTGRATSGMTTDEILHMTRGE